MQNLTPHVIVKCSYIYYLLIIYIYEENSDEDFTQDQGADVINFYTTKKTTGRVTHHLQVGLFRFNRRRVKPSGAAYFYCIEKNCKSSVRATYVESTEEPSDYEILNNDHSHPPDVTFQYVDFCKKNIKGAIQSDPLQPVLKVYEEEVKKMMDIIRETGDTLTLEDFPRTMPTGKIFKCTISR